MKVLIDANVLYPTVMREVVLGVAAAGLFEPQWSPRILEEWARAAARLGAEGEAQARGEIVMLGTRWPRASVQHPPELEHRLWLPDPADVHVLAAAIAGSSDIVLTSNAKDFPRNILAEEGLSRADPDGFLLGCFEAQPDAVNNAAQGVLAEARRLSGQDWNMRGLMKKARLPRLGKALERAAI
ncbi:RSP_2648 family PIN domain-containing protein [uncultured Tateyamaria sp.]|uniref:RSP_2648 family PIN domain-containing protein n=1 Tax=uncultured Tateyamaria sp. TaxID=455651 RepID=UPI002632D969|nr:PIN domain-containing protein [uncultured Tateyamaria sp.]